MPETKNTSPIQSNLEAISLTVTRLVGLSLRKMTNTAIANPPVLQLVHKIDLRYGRLMKKHHLQEAC